MTDGSFPDHADLAAGETARPVSIEEATTAITRVTDTIETVLVDQHDLVEHVLGAVMAGGHVLLADVPGVGKTTLARTLAQSLDVQFRRIQLTPDLLPSDITGVNVFNQKTQSFEFNDGPIFANVVLADELNRAPPKTQTALLEAMEEQQVTVDGETRPLPDPFVLIGTQNVIDGDRTYELPFAEVDRFMKRLSMGYPSEAAELELTRRTLGTHPIDTIEPVLDETTVRRLQATTQEITVEAPVRQYATSLSRYTREHASVGASPRATVQLLAAGQARALLEARDYVLPDDIKTEAPAVLAHRVRDDDPDRTGETIIANALESVPVQ